MTFMISTNIDATGFVSSARTAALALAWIRDRRADGACQFCIVDAHQRQICEKELASLAQGENDDPVWLDC